MRISASILACLLVTLPAAIAGDFARSMTPEEAQSAGLAKLTPEEFARLEAFAQRFKAGEVAKAKEEAKAQVAQETATKKERKLLPDWVSALVTLEKANSDPGKSDALENRLAGNFSGWSGRSTFRLENGQLWAQANSDSYEYAPTLQSPKVKIYPASMGTFWLKIEGVNQRCRVKPVKLQ